MGDQPPSGGVRANPRSGAFQAQPYDPNGQAQTTQAIIDASGGGPMAAPTPYTRPGSFNAQPTQPGPIQPGGIRQPPTFYGGPTVAGIGGPPMQQAPPTRGLGGVAPGGVGGGQRYADLLTRRGNTG